MSDDLAFVGKVLSQATEMSKNVHYQIQIKALERRPCANRGGKLLFDDHSDKCQGGLAQWHKVQWQPPWKRVKAMGRQTSNKMFIVKFGENGFKMINQ